MTTPEELAQLIESTVRAVLAGMQGTGGAGAAQPGLVNRSRRTIDPKGVSRVDAFSGKGTQWREWSFQFRVAIKAMEGKAADIVAKVETEEEGYKLEDLELEFVSLDVTKLAGEMFDLL